MNGSGRAQCRPLIGNSRMFLNKKKLRLYYDEDLKWKEVTWMLTSPSSNRPYAMQGLIKMTHWCSTNSQMDYQLRCMKTSTPINSPAHMNNGVAKPSINKRHSSISEHDLTAGAPHLPQQGPYPINGEEPPETTTPWIPLKDVSAHD